MTQRSVLLQAVKDWTRRTDSAFDAALGTMLLNFESRLAREVVHSSMTTVTTLALSGRTVTLPTDCLELRSLSVQTARCPLDWVSPEVLREGALWDSTGTPGQFAIEGRDIYVAPAATATLDLSYYARFPAMTADTDTTQLLQDYFDLYLHGMLVEAFRFVGDDDQKELSWNAAYVDTRRKVLSQDIDYQSSGSILRRIGSQDVV